MGLFDNIFPVFLIVSLFGISSKILFSIIQLDLRENNPFVFLWVAVLLTYFIPTFFDVLLGKMSFEYAGSTYTFFLPTIIKALTYFLLCITSYYLSIKLLSRLFPINRIDIQKINSTEEKGVYLVYLLIVITACGVFSLYKMFGMQVFSTGFVELRERVPGILGFAVQGLPKLYIGVILWFVVTKRKISAVMLTIFLTAIFLSIGGTRQNLIQIMLCGLLYFVFFWDVNKYKKIVIISMIAPLGIMVFSISKLLRNTGSLDERIDLLVTGIDVYASLGGIGEFFIRGVYYDFIEKYHQIPEFGQLLYFSRTLIFWLPGVIAGDLKPADFEYTMFLAFNGSFNSTMHPTFPGSIFADSGPFFWCWMMLLASVRHYTQYILSKEGGIRLAIGYVTIAMSCIMMGRGAIYAAVLVTLDMCILLHLFAIMRKLAIKHYRV